MKIKALLFQEWETCSQRMEASGLGMRGNPSALLNVLLHLTDQEERTKAIEAFRDGKKDVLVATDVASKGLDFPAIQHVINYDMPEEIENYGMKERDSWVGGVWLPGSCVGILKHMQNLSTVTKAILKKKY